MPTKLKVFMLRWAINTLAVLVAAQVVSRGIQYERPLDLLIASLVLGLLNAFVRPVLMLFALPLLFLTLGLFTLVINALMLYCVGWLLPGFHVATFGAAFWGALIISVVSLALNTLTGTRTTRVECRTDPPKSHRAPPPGKGPVIDV